jgi:hypothetical protein
LDVDEVVAAIDRSGLPHAEGVIDGWRRVRR